MTIVRLRASDMTTSDDIYILHSRKYRDTSLLIDVLSYNEGRYSLVVRGARGSKSKISGIVQPYRRLNVTVYGKGELRTAGKLEPTGAAFTLGGENLLLGLYVNELLYRILGKFDPMPELYEAYEQLLASLADPQFDMASLRQFELHLLMQLGYGITFDLDAGNGEFVSEGNRYRFVAEEGFHCYQGEGENLYKGADLLAIAAGDMTGEREKIVRQIVRRSLKPLLGNRPLKSRDLFVGRA